jgi:hypothetical protein
MKSPDIIRVIKSRRITWVGHVACMGEIRATGFSQGNLRETDLLENPEIEWRILKRIFNKWDGRAWIGFIWLRTGTGGGPFVNAVMNVRVP